MRLFRLCLLALAVTLCQLPASAYDFMADGIAYNILAEPGTVGVTSSVAITSSTTGYPNYADVPELTIPETVEHDGMTYQVTRILDKAFARSKSLTHVEIPNTVTEIGAQSFYLCISLKETVLPSSVTKLGDLCFAGCAELERATIEGALDGIPYGAFWLCVKLESIDMPQVGGIIGDVAFSNCSSLRSIDIPDGVTRLNRNSFQECAALESVHIGKSLSFIAGTHNQSNSDFDRQPAFTGIRQWKEITVSPENTVFDSRDNCNAIILTAEDKMLFACQNTVIPSTVKTIYEAYKDCQGLDHVEIPEGVVKLSGPFAGSDVKSVAISSTVTQSGTFYGADQLQRIVVSQENPIYDSRDNCNAIIETSCDKLVAGCKETVIPPTVKSIGTSAFSGIKSIEYLHIPSQIESIAKGALKCPNLRVLSYDAANCQIECSSIINIPTPDYWMEELGMTPFALDDNTVIQLDSVIFGEHVQEIPENLLWGQEHLKQVKLPNESKSIGRGAFGSTGINQFVLPEGVTALGCSAFTNTPLQRFVCQVSNPDIAEVVTKDGKTYTPFDAIPESCVLHVPQGKKEAFEQHPGWQGFKHVVEIALEPADVNSDFVIDIIDVNEVINAMLGKGSASLTDVTGDGKVDIGDINAVINAMLGK